MNKIYILYSDTQDEPHAYFSSLEEAIKVAIEYFEEKDKVHYRSFDGHIREEELDTINLNNSKIVWKWTSPVYRPVRIVF